MGYRVTGAVAVLKLKGGNGDERYLYHGAPVDGDVYLKASVEHAIEVGLVAEVEDPEVAPTAPAVPPEGVAPAAPPAKK